MWNQRKLEGAKEVILYLGEWYRGGQIINYIKDEGH